MSGRRGEQPAAEEPPVALVDAVEQLQPGDLALVYLATPGWRPPVIAPADVIDVTDDITEVRAGDTAVIYLNGSEPGLVSGTVESVMARHSKRPAQITFTAPVITGDPDSTRFSVAPQVTPATHTFVRAYRVNQPRVLKRARQALDPAGDSARRDVPAAFADGEPSIVSGVIKTVEPWGLAPPGHLIHYAHAVLPDGTYQFPLQRDSAYAYITAYRHRAPVI